MSNPYKIDWNEYAALARQAVAEGCVLLKNDDKALPIRKGERVSVFGRIQFDYYKSGTGSGGAVNTRYVTNILDALKENKDISVNEELEQTYRDWLGPNFDPDLFEPGDYGAGSGNVAFGRLLDRRPGIDAVFCASDRMAIGALETAYRRGRHVPGDLLVMGFDDHQIAAQADPPLSTIHQPIREIGRTAASTLLAAMAGETPSDKIFPTQLVVRGSTWPQSTPTDSH